MSELKPLTKRERAMLRIFVIHGSTLYVNRKGRALWDGDITAQCNAAASLKRLAERRLVVRYTQPYGAVEYRRTPEALEYVCRASGCYRGGLFAEGADGRDHEVGKCRECEGVGITKRPWNRRAEVTT